ncbi:MAG: ABC transporter ATP-binding protein/permease [Gemmatimonadota bacterium]|nr:ABC transporter ATP-binding protein/permease [Gemmatimonadota bacterium]
MLPLLELAVADAGTESGVMRFVREFLGNFGLQPSFGVLLLAIIVGLFLKGAFLWMASQQVGYTVANVATDLRLMLIRALLRARWGYFVGQPAGHISNAIGSEAHRASMAYSAACAFLAVVIQALVYAVLAFLISPSVAFAALAAGAAVTLVFHRLVTMSKDAGRRQTQLSKSLSGRLIDALHGLKPIKAMAQEHHLQPILEAETHGLNEAQRRQVLASGTMSAFREPLVVVMLAAGLYLLLTYTDVLFSSLLVMAFLFHRLVGRINLLQTHQQSLVISESAFWSLKERVDAAEAEREPSKRRRPPPPLEQGIRIDRVRFGYTDRDVLQNASLEIPAGRFVAIVGPSGVGKTTIADLVIGLYMPREGEVYIDDVPLREIDLTAWRRMIGYVPQEMLLFHDSILRNVTLGDQEISRDEVMEALDQAGAAAFVNRLPEGIDTVIGERGSMLSGGQRQRISIARALVRKPKLLVLDEVTTALDPETEAAICATLRDLPGGVTILSISHQPAMTRVADVVYRLEGGSINRQDAGTVAVGA